MSTIKVVAVETRETFPIPSIALAVRICAPSLHALEGVKTQSPLDSQTTDPKGDEPSKSVTVLWGSADPVIVGFDELVLPLEVAMTGLSGADASTTIKTPNDEAETLPAESCALAETEWEASLSATDGVRDQAPLEVASVTPRIIEPSKTVMVLNASAVPEMTGLALFVSPPLIFIKGASGAIVSNVVLTAVERPETLPARSLALAEKE
jgi:hypothetical protein